LEKRKVDEVHDGVDVAVRLIHRRSKRKDEDSSHTRVTKTVAAAGDGRLKEIVVVEEQLEHHLQRAATTIDTYFQKRDVGSAALSCSEVAGDEGDDVGDNDDRMTAVIAEVTFFCCIRIAPRCPVLALDWITF